MTPPPKCCKAASTAKVLGPRRRARKSVRISTEENQVTFRHASRDELQSSWYQTEEYQSFKRDGAATIRAFRAARFNLGALDPKDQCVRGLEMQATPEIFQFRANGIKSTIRGVLQQQQVQRHLGQKDYGTLGMVSMMYSKSARNLASSLAAIDAQSC